MVSAESRQEGVRAPRERDAGCDAQISQHVRDVCDSRKRRRLLDVQAHWFLAATTTIRNCGSDTNLAVFLNNTWSSGGTLEFQNGRKARATTNLWMTRMEFRTEADEPLVRFDYGGAFRLSAKVMVFPTGWQAEDLPLFVLFGWYLAVMLYEEASAVAVITS